MARPYETSDEIAPIKYHQVRQAELGFIAGLSVLDLIFNVGALRPRYSLDKSVGSASGRGGRRDVFARDGYREASPFTVRSTRCGRRRRGCRRR